MKYLYGHINETTAKVVEDYPYGFRLRCKIRYWIESKEGKTGGQRFCSQTTNPKKSYEHWNAPKKSTYSPVLIMTENEENGHIGYTGLANHIGNTDEDRAKLVTFREKHGDNLTDFQKDQVRILLALHDAYKHVTYKIESRPSRTPEEQAAHDAEQTKTKETINKLTGYYYQKGGE